MKILVLVFAAVSLHAQIAASFSPGLKVARGAYRWSVTACSVDAVTIDSGWVYQAAEGGGIPALSVTEALRLANRAHARNPFVIATNSAQFASQAGAYLVASGTIHGDPRITGYLLLASGASSMVGMFLRPNLPPDYASNLLQGQISIPAGGCVQREIFARQMRAARVFHVVIDVPKAASK